MGRSGEKLFYCWEAMVHWSLQEHFSYGLSLTLKKKKKKKKLALVTKAV
jgi:hypothetical protein